MNDVSSFEMMSPALRRVLDALLTGATVAEADRNALTEAEQAELASLVRTARLVRVSLHQPEPTAESAENALHQALDALGRTGARPGREAEPEPAASALGLIDRLRRLLGIPIDSDD
jgi:hypothetical protein